MPKPANREWNKRRCKPTALLLHAALASANIENAIRSVRGINVARNNSFGDEIQIP
jgi:hypothetical protein